MTKHKHLEHDESAEMSEDELAEVTGGLVRAVPRPIDPGLFANFDLGGLGSFSPPVIRPMSSTLFHKDNDPPPPPPPPPVTVGSTGGGFGVKIGGTF